MKLHILFICCILPFLTVNSKVLPKRLPQFCKKSHPDYNACTKNVLTKMGPHLLKGIREINFPRMHPFQLPLFLVNRTISEIVSISATIKNMEVWGYDELELKSFRLNTNSLKGELSVHMPHMRVRYEFDISGRLLTFVLDNSGHFETNVTNVDIAFKFALSPVDKLGVKYYEFKSFKAKINLEDSHIRLLGNTENDQEILGTVENVFNVNPRVFLDAVAPIFDESIGIFFKGILDPVLGSIPAEELLPE